MDILAAKLRLKRRQNGNKKGNKHGHDVGKTVAKFCDNVATKGDKYGCVDSKMW